VHQIGISQLVIGRERRLEEWVPQIKAAGYDCLELVLSDSGDLTMASGETDYQRLRELSQRHGVDFVSICPALSQPMGLTTGNVEHAARFRQVVEKLLEAGQALGIDAVLVIPGGVTPDVRYDIAYARALDGMGALAPLAEKAGVALAIEYVWNMLFLSPLEMRRFLDEIGSPGVGFYFDPGNMAIFGYPEQWVELTAPHIKRVHLKDWDRKTRSWPQLLDGDVDFPRVMAALHAAGYTGPLISEVDGDWDTRAETAHRMRRIAAM
jgi:L-ribulose-5-phosphate 3-epimerase